jgi:hypothetical protein
VLAGAHAIVGFDDLLGHAQVVVDVLQPAVLDVERVPAERVAVGEQHAPIRSAHHGAVVLGPAGVRYLDQQRVEGGDPLAPFSSTAEQHLLRTDRFRHVADIMIGSFYDPMLDVGSAFEELIFFHGELGGPQTRAFILHPERLPLPERPLVGAAAVHGLLFGWRSMLQRRSREPVEAGQDSTAPRVPARSR